MGSGWRDTHYRYLVHFADGGAGMRFYDRPLEPGDEIADGGEPYRIVRVEERSAVVAGFGHPWAEPRDG